MKIRADFVTNSSSSSFVAYAIYSDELCSFIHELIEAGDLSNKDNRFGEYYGITPCSYLMEIERGVSITVQLGELSSRRGKSFNIFRNSQEEDERTARQIIEDNINAKDIGYLHSAVSHFFDSLQDSPWSKPSEKDIQLDEILERALSDNEVRARTFMDFTDGFIGEEVFNSYEPPVSFWIEDGVLLKYDEQPGVTSVVVPSNVKRIGANAFRSARELVQVRIPSSVKSIGNGAFQNCSSLMSVELPGSINEIPNNAFRDCTTLETVNLPDSVKVIGDRAFMGCIALKSIKANGLSSIGRDAFKKCDDLVQIPVTKQVAQESLQTGGLQGKIVVHTGFSKAEEKEIDELVMSAGGVVKSSVVLTTNYLVYNPEYGHETVKLKRAKELIASGKDIAIMTLEGFYSLMNAAEEAESKSEKQEDVTLYTTLKDLKKSTKLLTAEASSVLGAGGRVTIECELPYGKSTNFKDLMNRIAKEVSAVGIVESGPTEGSKSGRLVLAPKGN